MKNDKLLTIYKTVALISASIVLSSGFFYLLSWYFGWINFLKIPPSVEYVSLGSSLAIFLSGLAIFALFFIQSFPLANILGIVILSIVFLRILELAFNLKLGITELIVPLIPFPQVSFSLMPGVSIFSFSLTGLVLMSWTRYKRYPLLSTLILQASLIIFLLGVSGVISFLVPVQFSIIHHQRLLNFYSQISTIFIGIGLIASSYYFDIRNRISLTKRLPLVVTIALSIFSIWIAWKLAIEKTYFIEELLQYKLNEIKNKIYVRANENFVLSEQLSVLMEQDNNHSFLSKSPEITSYIQTQEGLRNILWVDPHIQIVSSIPPLAQNELNQILVLSPHDADSLKSTILQKTKVPLTLISSNVKNNNLLIMSPTYWNNALQGFVVFVIDLREFFEKEFVGILDHEFALTIVANDKRIFSVNDKDLNLVKHWKNQDNLSLGKNLSLSLSIYPTEQLLSILLNKTLIYLIPLGGFTVALCVGALLHFWQLANSKIDEGERFKRQLLNAEKEQQDTLKSVQVGTWNWDLRTNQFHIDDYSHILFGIESGKFKGSYRDLLNLVIPEDRKHLKQYFKHCLKTKNPIDCSFRVLWPNETIHWIVSKGKFFFNKEGVPEKMTGINWDITPIKQSQQFLEISESISKILSENAPISNTLDKIIQTLFYSFKWSVMVLWLYDSKINLLKPAFISHAPSINIPEFEKATQNLDLQNVHHTPNYIWVNFRPVWHRNITEDPNFARSKEALKEGIKGAFAFPIFAGPQVIGIIELFKQHPFVDDVNEGLLNLMTSIGIGVGQYLQRRAVEEAHMELAAIITNAQNAIYSLSLDGIIKNWNKGAENMFGWKIEEAIGQPISIIYPPNQIHDFAKILDQVLSGHLIEHFKTQSKRKDGSLIWVDKTIVTIKDFKGKPTAMAFIAQDISKEKDMIDALKSNEKKFRDFVEATEEWFWEMDLDLTLTYSNPVIKLILGYSNQEIVGKKMLSLLPDEVDQQINSQIQNCIRIKEGWSKRTIPWKHKDGSMRWLESNAHPVINENNEIIGFRGVDRDVTERQMIEKTKNEFISMVNHELRSPLTSILGALGLFRIDPSLSEKLKELSTIAYRNAERLTSIVNDILSIEKTELGKIDFNLKPISIVEVIDEAIVSSKPMADKFGIRLIKEGSFTDVKVFADKKRLIQVLMNLFSNAFKFSPSGSTVFITMLISDFQVRVSIRDQGIGIPEEFKSKIFQKFAQANIISSKMQTGTGLGLNVCKNLIEGMKGTISFTSMHGKGSTFYFNLPRWLEKS